MLKATALILPLFLMGCNDASVSAGADKSTPPKTQAAPASAMAPAAPPDLSQVTGTVLETIDAAQYTYVRMKTNEGEIWAAVTAQPLKTGSEVTIGNAMWMENFESKTLKRTFARVLFGSIGAPGVAAAAAAAELPPGHPPTTQAAGAAPAPSVAADVKVEKAPGGKTIAEIYAEKATLKDKEVVVRGTVVKWNAEIMGRNWLHLRDGSGSAEKGTNDLTVTTDEVVTKGSVVTVRGKLGLDRDFTAGYAYPVILEGAKIVK